MQRAPTSNNETAARIVTCELCFARPKTRGSGPSGQRGGAFKKFELATSSQTDARKREVQLLVSIAEPDPEYQPFLLTDEASLLDAVGTDPMDIALRLKAYFGVDMNLDLSLPIWRLVDIIKRLRPGWPGDPGAP